MKLFVRLATASLFGLSTVIVGGLPVACSDGDSTTGKRVSLEVRIAASPESKQFTNAAGWSITLTKARVATGAFYFYDGETIFSGIAPRRAPGLVKSAFAHPGHYVPGNAKGEMLVATSADLLSGATLGTGNGVTGPFRSATFTFDSPAKGPMAAELGANVAVLEGTATKGAETRAFRAEIGPDDVKDTKGVTQIEGCPFEVADVQGDGAVTITVKLTQWLDQVAFDDVPKSADETPVTLPDGLARNQLVRGVKVGLGYVFSYAPR